MIGINLVSFVKKILKFNLVNFFFAPILFTLIGCSEKIWKDHGDSCIQISENPPLKRVINYTDHDLCGRKLSPRIAPNPKTRFRGEKN